MIAKSVFGTPLAVVPPVAGVAETVIWLVFKPASRATRSLVEAARTICRTADAFVCTLGRIPPPTASGVPRLTTACARYVLPPPTAIR